MDQSELEIKINIWKKLAVSKQMLIRVATDSLGLDPECSMDSFKKELDEAILKGKNADAVILRAQEQAKHAVDEIAKKVIQTEQLLKEEKRSVGEAIEAKKTMEKRVISARSANAKELKKLTVQLADKEKSLRLIHLALADSPENVVRKLKNLKKEKFDEVTARKRVEDEIRSLKQEKRSLQNEKQTLKKIVEQSFQLVEQHKRLHKFSVDQHDALKSLAGDSKTFESIPHLDEQLIDEISVAAGKEKAKSSSLKRNKNKSVKHKMSRH